MRYNFLYKIHKYSRKNNLKIVNKYIGKNNTTRD